jgi:hypothetical protein
MVDLHLRRTGDHHKVQVSDKGCPGAILGSGGQSPKAIGPPSYAKASQEGIRMAIVCDGYRGVEGVSGSGLQI